MKNIGKKTKLTTVAAAFMLSTSVLALSNVAYAGDQTSRININSKPLAEALIDIARQMDVTITSTGGLTKGKFSSNLQGSMTVGEALQDLLYDSNLSYRRNEDGSYAIVESTGFQKIGFTTDAEYQAELGVYEDDERADEVDALEIETIVVTANRREQNLQDVPMAVSVVRPEEFKEAGLLSLGDIITYVPGFDLNNSWGGPDGYGNIGARGVGQIGWTAVVSVYVDDLPITSSGSYSGANNIFLDSVLLDVERIEFLKGPQGTLYGANSIGGAIKYITRKPSLDEYRGSASVDLSSTKNGGFSKLFSGKISTPIVEDRLGITISGYYDDDAGFVDFVDGNTGEVLEKGANNSENYGFSADLFFRASDRLELRARVFQTNTEYQGFSRADLKDGTRIPKFDMFSSGTLFLPNEIKHTYYSGEIEYQFDGITLISSTGYGKSVSELLDDATPFYGGVFADGLSGHSEGTTTSVTSGLTSGHEKFVQELRLVSDNSETVEWLGGIYFTDQKGTLDQKITAQPTEFNQFALLVPSDYREYAAFANITYYVTPELDFGVGGRISQNEVSIKQILSGPLAGGNFTSDPISEKDTVATYSFSTRYRVDEDMSLYGRIANSYRPGFTNLPVFVDGENIAPPFVEPDNLWSYEIGAKGKALDGRLNYDFALWYIKWSDFQAELIINNAGVLNNATNGITAKGFEGGLTFRPVNGLALNSTVAYTDSTLDEDEPALNGSKAGEFLPELAKWKLAITARYDYSISTSVDAFVRGGARYVSGKRSAFGPNNPIYSEYDVPTEGYTLFDVSVGLTFSDNVSFIIYATNLLNKNAFSNIDAYRIGEGIDTWGVPIKPRKIGAILSVDF